MNLNITQIDNELIINFRPLLDLQQKIYKISGTQDEYPIKFYTATTTMKDFIGNITAIYDDKCSVEGVFYGTFQTVHNVILQTKLVVGERVMVTEHLKINGHIELMATKKRVLLDGLNFVNVGWSSNRESRFLRIDVYTGEYKQMIGPPTKGRVL